MSIKNLLLTLIAISLLSLGGWGLYFRANKTSGRLTDNLSQAEIKYQALNGRIASQSRMLSATSAELKRAHAKSDELKSAYDRQLEEANAEIKNLKLRPARVVTVTKTQYIAQDSGLVSRDSILKMPFIVSRPHYRFELYRKGDSIYHRHAYWNSLTVVVSRERYFKNGARIKHPTWYFWKRWNETSTVVSDDSLGTATIKVSVRFI